MNEPFVGHFEDIIVDEISLEGLEGITLEGLWVRLAEVLKVKPPLRWRISVQTWNFIVKLSKHFQFFALPNPRPALKITNRFELLSGDAADKVIDECPSRKYKYNLIEDGAIRGSCEFYNQRVEINHEEIVHKTLNEINEIWGNTFIIVAAQHLREQSLILDTHVPWLPGELQSQTYCYLERIGRARQYGEATIGKHSLLSMCNESVIIFYIRNRLSHMRLIKKQLYYEKSQSGSLIHLVRFPAPQLPVQLLILTDAIQYLKNHKGLAEPVKLKAYLSSKYELCIKKFTKTTMFRKYIGHEKILYRELYPEAKREEYLQKNNKKQERSISVWKLVDPNITIDDIFEEEEGEDEESAKSFMSKENLYLDISMTEQIYEVVKSYGPQGVSQTALGHYLGCRKLCMRRLIKKVSSIGLVGYYLKDEGRQRMRMYVATKFLHNNADNLDNADNMEVEQAPEAATIECVSDVVQTPECELPPTGIEPRTSMEISDINEPDFKMIVKVSQLDESSKPKPFTVKSTERQILRRNLVLKIASQTGVVDAIQLIRGIISSERNLGYSNVICRKSLSRILQPLVEQKLINIYEVRMQWREYSKRRKLVCAAPVNLEHSAFNDELLTIKDTFFNGITMKKRKEALPSSVKMAKKMNEFFLQKRTSDRVGAAKYIRAKLVHEILFHLAYVLKSDQRQLTFNEAARAWSEYDMSIDASELSHELPRVFSAEVNWTMFISPLPNYESHPEGWICIKDFLLRIPLLLLAKMHGIQEDANPVLQEYLRHPIRRYYTIHGLPLEVRDIIRFDRSYATTVDQILRLLGYMGLVQFGPREFKDPVYNFIYLNRRAVVFDTTTSDAAYSKVSDDRDYRKLSFYLESPSDIVDYWLTLQNICMATKLGYRGRKDQSEKPFRFVLDLLPEVKIEDASTNDSGYIVGNGRGAAGMDWTLFAHKMRNWDLSFHARKQVGDVHKLRPKMRYAAQKMPQKGIRHVFYKRYKKHVIMRKVRKVIYDEVDKECLQRMEHLRVRWNEKEDRMLLICRVATNFLQGNSGQKVSIAFTCRDILQWILGSMQKSSLACQRRILYLMRNKANVNQVNSWLNELYQNEYVNRTYGPNFYVQLRKYYRSVDMFCVVARIYFVQLVCFLVQLLDNAKVQHTETIPDTLQQFSLLYRKTYDTNTAVRHFDPKSVDEVNESTINLLIHSSVCSQRDKMLYNIQLFEIYRAYDEGMLEKCFRKVRFVDQLVVSGKIMSKKKFPLLGKNVCISNLYRQQFFCLLPYVVYEQSHATLNMLLESIYRPDRPKITYTCVNNGTATLLLELALIPCTNFEIQIPKQVLKFDPTQLQSSAYNPDKVIDHFVVFDKNLPMEYSKDIANESLLVESKKIQFHVNVTVHKIVYNPYDVFSRLSDSYIHFFCALQHLNSTVTMDNLQTRPYNCPFRCILQDADYLSTLAQLIKEHESVIRQLAKVNMAATMKNEEDSALFKSTVNLTSQNILLVTNFVQSEIQKLSDDDTKKDVGLNHAQHRYTDVVQLALDALKLSYEMDGHVSDEEDLLLERSEGNPRFQDLLVVNTPMLSVNFNNENEELVPYKQMQVPRSLLPSLDKKQAVLERAVEDALWKNYENTIDDLKAEMQIQGFTAKEKYFTVELLAFIENSEIGVKASELVATFHSENMLLKSLTVLRKLSFIKRVGVESFTYVDRKKMRPWIIHSFHLKRLDRESMPPQGDIDFEAAKRKCEKTDDANCDQPETKRPKLEAEPSTSTGKRVPKPLTRYSDASFSDKEDTKPIEKIKVHMRPAPWIRVNGSLNRRVFDRWIGTLLLECTIRSSIPVNKLFARFHQLHPVNIRFLLECLEDLDCLELKCTTSPTTTLFTEEEHIEISKGNELNNPENLFVIVKPDALLKLSLFIGDKKYQIDF